MSIELTYNKSGDERWNLLLIVEDIDDLGMAKQSWGNTYDASGEYNAEALVNPCALVVNVLTWSDIEESPSEYTWLLDYLDEFTTNVADRLRNLLRIKWLVTVNVSVDTEDDNTAENDVRRSLRDIDNSEDVSINQSTAVRWVVEAEVTVTASDYDEAVEQVYDALRCYDDAEIDTCYSV